MRVGLGESAGSTRAIAFGPGDQLRAATMTEGGIRVWRIGPGSGWAIPFGPAVPGFAAAFSPDGRMLAVGGDSVVTLTEAAPDRPRHALRTGGWPIRALAFSRDGQLLAAAGERGVTLWDTASGGEQAATRIGPRDAVSLVIGPDGRSLVTGGRDGWVRFWDLETGRQPLALRPHACYVIALALSDDGRALAAASACERVAPAPGRGHGSRVRGAAGSHGAGPGGGVRPIGGGALYPRRPLD
jgi:WD40 repeat protein